MLLTSYFPATLLLTGFTLQVRVAVAKLDVLASNITVGINVLLADVSYERAHGVYLSIKAYLCCELPDEAAHM